MRVASRRAKARADHPTAGARHSGGWELASGDLTPSECRLAAKCLGSGAEPLRRAILEGKRHSKKAFRGSTVSNLTHQHPLKSNETKLYLKSRAQAAKERVLLLPAELRNLN